MHFHGLDPATGDLIRRNKPFVMSMLPAALDGFYAHVEGYQEASRFFKSADHVAHAKSMQIRHWELITEGRFDAAYVASVTRIGQVHNKIGLSPTWYIGGYGFLLAELLKGIMARASRFGSGRDEAVRLQQAITRALMLDMDFAISVYLDEGRRERGELLERLANQFETAVGGVVNEVAAASEQVNRAAEDLSRMSADSLSQAASVADASEEASTNVATVASAAEELTASIAEIARQAEDASKISDQARMEADQTSAQVTELSVSASKIDEVVELINRIAAQTNLLALNATIEAARAGDAGRGFAVVASEVKQLANETAKATQTIAAQIAEIQASTSRSTASIGRILEVVRSLNGVSGAIAAAVEQQGAATREISRNVQNAAEGTTAVSRSIDKVSEAAKATKSASTEMSTASGELGRQSGVLAAEVRRFLTEIRSA